MIKNKTTTILSVVAALVTVLCITGPAGASPLARPNLAGGAPSVVSYQGQVIVDGSPYNGTGYCKFAIVDADGTTSYWSNDGSSSDGGEPEASVPLTVTDGLFNVLLGDTTLANMTEPLTAETFDGTGRYLRVWFSADDSEYLLLAPDRRIAAVPYALQAQEAAYAADAANAGLLDGQDGSYYQARVSEVCPAGYTIYAINPDGTVSCRSSGTGGNCPVGSTLRIVSSDGTYRCQPDALNRAVGPTANISTILDGRTEGVGRYTSITIGQDGLGLISYYDVTNGDLKVAHCDDPACTSATVNTVDGAGDVGQHTSITIGADGLPLVSYYDVTNRDLKVAHCRDWTCTSTISTTVSGSTGDVGLYNSITIGADGLPLVSYYDVTNGEVRVAHCDDLACTSASHNLIDYTEENGYNSVTIGVDGLPLISYYQYDDANDSGDLKVAHCDDVACTSVTLNTLDSGEGLPWTYYGLYTSVTIGADGLPLISYSCYHDAFGDDMGYLKVAHCGDPTCSSSTTPPAAIPDSGEGIDYYYTSVTIGADGLPLISYYQYDDVNDVGELKVAHCSNLDCTSATVTTLNSVSDLPWNEEFGYTSVTIGADGLPLISYFDEDDSALKVFHCGSVFCTPYFRRR